MDEAHSGSMELKDIQRKASNSEGTKTEPLRVEDVFKSLGGYSRFQIFATLTMITLEIPAAMIYLSPILTGTQQVTFYCDSEDSKNFEDGKKSAIISFSEVCSNSCNGSIKSVDGEPYLSVVQEWELYCDRDWITETLSSIQMLGSMLGPVVTAHIADQYGRKPAFYFICFCMGVSGVLSANANTLWFYGTSRFLAGFAAGGGLVAHMNYLMEYLTPSWRVICGSVTLWPLGEILLGVSGYFLPSWRHLTLVTSLPAFLLFITVPFLHESPRWLLCQKKTDQALHVFNSIAWWNGKPKVSRETILKLQESVAEENDEGDETKTDTEKGTKNISNVRSRFAAMKNRDILKHIIILALCWFANALAYVGISFNMKNMSGNRYLNVVLLGAFDFPAELSGIYFSNRYGRKSFFITCLALASVFLACLAVLQLTIDQVDVNYGALIITLCLLGKFFNEASWAVMACLTGEVFPTVVRSISFSICSTFSGVGGVIAPQMAFLGKAWAPGPYIIFCGLSLMSCIAALYLPEMRGKPLQDSATSNNAKGASDEKSP